MTVDETAGERGPEASDAPLLQIALLGGLEVRVLGAPLPKLRARSGLHLLALLALRHGQPVERRWLADTLWPDSADSRGALKRTLTDLRAALGPAAACLTEPRPGALQLGPDRLRLDTDQLERAAAAGDDSAVAALCAGALLPGVYDDWSVGPRRRVDELHRSALRRLAAAAASRGDLAGAALHRESLVRLAPRDEGAWRDWMEALADSGNVAAALEAFRELSERLKGDGAAPSPATEALRVRLRAQVREAPPRRSEGALPRPATAFVGRERELAQTLDLLQTRRCVTLTGPGGIGKTRLAVRAAEAARERFPDGAWFVDLTALHDPQLVPGALAAALGVAETAERAAGDALLARLRRKQALLLLDNCEHLRDACADAAQALLDECPGVTLLATSREPLRVAGEAQLRVGPLPLPAADADLAPDALRAFDSVRLFLARAEEKVGSLALTPPTAAALVQVCRGLDGIPLALELAAARLSALSVGQIAERLDERFQLLRAPARTVADHHRTLDAVVERSWALLNPTERETLASLGAFAGGWTLDAARAVALPESASEYETLDRLVRLIDASLVGFDPETGRYDMLETIRQWSAQQLSCDRFRQIRERHADWAAARAEHLGEKHPLALDPERDNLRAALDWTHQSDPARALRLTLAVGGYFGARGLLREGRQRIEAALALTDGRPRERAGLLRDLCEIKASLGELEACDTLARERLALAEVHGDPAERADALTGVAHAAYHCRQLERAEAHIQEAQALWRDLGRPDRRAAAAVIAGYIAFRREGPDAAQRVLESLLPLPEDADPMLRAEAENLAGWVARGQGRFVAAQEHHRTALEVHRARGQAAAIAYTLCYVGWAQTFAGDSAGTYDGFRESHDIAQELGGTILLAMAAEGLATAERALGMVDFARVHFAESRRCWAQVGYTRDMARIDASVAALDDERPALPRAA